MPPIPPMTLCIALICAVLGGLLGGGAAFLANINFLEKEYKHDRENLTGRAFCVMVAVNAFLGVTGALVALLALIFLKDFPEKARTQDVVFLLGLSVVGGFGARRFLPLMVMNLEGLIRRTMEETQQNTRAIAQTTQRINESEQNLAKVKDKIEEDVQKQNQQILIVSAAMEALKRPETPESLLVWLLKSLQECEDKMELSADGFLTIGRLHRRLRDLDEAIKILTRYIDQNRSIGAPNSAYSAMLYNRACYYGLLYEKTRKADFADHAFADLARALEFAPDKEKDRALARNDNDFDSLKGDPRFVELTRMPKSPAPDLAAEQAPKSSGN